MIRTLRAALAAFALAFFCAPTLAQIPPDSLAVRPGAIRPLGYCQLSVTATAKETSTCPGGIPSGATYAFVSEEGPDAVRWRDDGTPPTATVGQPLGNGTAAAPVQAGFTTTFSTLQWIDQGTSGAIVDISFY